MQPHINIEIDLPLHKAIEAERQSFSESPSDILHRLIRKAPSGAAHLSDPEDNGRAWLGAGVELPHGTKLRMTYNGRKYTAEIDEGRWLVEGDYYNAPSAASYAVARTRGGEPAHLNGWDYWWALLPGHDKWRLLSTMRNLGTNY